MRAHGLANILGVSITDVVNLSIRLQPGRQVSEFTILGEQTALAVVDHFEREAKRDRFAEARKAIAKFTKSNPNKE